MIRCIRVEYTLRAEVDLAEYERAVGEFVAGVAAHHPQHRYAVFRVGQERQFVHVGQLVEAAVTSLQAEPFFSRFTGYLRERCEKGPEVTPLTRIAFTPEPAR